MTLALAASLFFTAPAPLEMPRAEAYLVKQAGGERRLEDRYDAFDLWLARAVVGRWMDDDWRVFALARLDALPPALAATGTRTRVQYEAERAPADRKRRDHLARMVDALSPVEPAAPDEYSSPRQMPRGYRDVLYCHGTNESAIVCAFLPEKAEAWLLATWELAEGDDHQAMLAAFEREFLDERAWEGALERVAPRSEKGGGARGDIDGERAIFRADLARAVAAYDTWHVTDAEEFAIVDDLGSRTFVEALTNDLPVMRAKYAAAIPSPLDGSNTLCVARIFSSRDEYLDAAADGMEWIAAYWNPSRRELVAYLPPQGERELVRTIRHEAFHQYLSYAAAMLAASPWFNEGYAQYFEDTEDDSWGVEVDLDALEDMLPALLQMDYREFYAGGDAARRLKYRLAWSIAYFIENGAPKVRFQPFKNLKRDYMESLLRHHSGDGMRIATAEAFGSADRLKQFIAEWKRFWLQHGA